MNKSNIRMEQTEGKNISELKDKKIDIIQSFFFQYCFLERNRLGGRGRSEHSFKDLRDYNKISNIFIISTPEGEKKYSRAERVLLEIIAAKYLSLIADINLQVQKAEQTPNRINSEINTKRQCNKTSEN